MNAPFKNARTSDWVESPPRRGGRFAEWLESVPEPPNRERAGTEQVTTDPLPRKNASPSIHRYGNTEPYPTKLPNAVSTVTASAPKSTPEHATASSAPEKAPIAIRDVPDLDAILDRVGRDQANQALPDPNQVPTGIESRTLGPMAVPAA